MKTFPTVVSCMLVTHSNIFVRAFNRAFAGQARIHGGIISAFPPTRTTRLHSTLAPEEIMNSTLPEEKIQYPIEMTEEEKYLFDLNGFIIVRGVLNPEEIEVANKAIDNHAHEMVERSDAALRNALKDTKFYGKGPGRMDLGQVLEWGEESRV